MWRLVNFFSHKMDGWISLIHWYPNFFKIILIHTWISHLVT
jgi:hypothetical protein